MQCYARLFQHEYWYRTTKSFLFFNLDGDDGGEEVDSEKSEVRERCWIYIANNLNESSIGRVQLL